MFKNILVPVDIGEVDVAKPGFEEAVELAKLGGGVLRLIHVRSPVPYAMNEYIPAEYYDTDEKAALNALENLGAKLDLPKGRVTAISPFGSVYDEVLKEAARINADLIVVGSHRPDWSTYFIGSNASNIVRHAKCSVLVMRPPGTPAASL
ncbi:MAG: universal stress protein [Hyphomicrobiales bacterium]|nr:universal stress protein [Hyphomicrobiales bacterium]